MAKMILRKIISAVLVVCFCVGILPQGVFAVATASKTEKTGYTPVRLNLKDRIELKIPKFDGIPEHNESGNVYYSSTGSLKLKIDSPEDKKLFNNGAKIKVWLAPKPKPRLNLNWNDWDKFLSYSVAKDVNRFSIKGPKFSEPHYFPKFIEVLAASNRYVRYPVSIFGAITCYYFTSVLCNFLKNLISIYGSGLVLTLTPYYMSYGVFTSCASVGIIKTFEKILKPLINLFNPGPSTVDFNYGIVLTSKDDEKALSNDPLPKEGDLKQDAVKKEITERNASKKLNEELRKANLETRADGRYSPVGAFSFDPPSSKTLSKEEAKVLADKCIKDKLLTQKKLSETKPITEGFVCELDADHPEQTFRFVINDQMENLDAALFSLALSENIGSSFASQANDDCLSLIFEHVLPVSDEAKKLREKVKNGMPILDTEDGMILLEKAANIMNKRKTISFSWKDLLKSIMNFFFFFQEDPDANDPNAAQQPQPPDANAPNAARRRRPSNR